MRIAVVDDDASVREGAVLVLEADGRDVAAFPSGDAFLSEAKEASQWDLAFLDLKMPGSSGFDVLRALQVDDTLPFPVVMIS
ncbi:MAG: response regulator, partial [Pseudomonadota bacterium]